MKLLTKEWYMTMHNSGLGVMLRADDRAAVFSEELYRQVREEKRNNWLADQRELQEYLEEPYDEAAACQSFAELYDRELEEFRTRTPEKILEKVADVRMLALGLCTEEVYRDFKQYRALCEKWTEKTMEEAWNMRISQGLEKAFTGEHSLHDSFVLAMKREGEDLVIEFEYDEDATWPEIKAIRFRDAEILKQEQPMENAWWLYDEIWRTEEETIEIHALLWKENEVFELTVECRDTEILWTVPPVGTPCAHLY